MKDIIRKIKDHYRLVFGVLIVGIFLGWLFFHPSKAERVTIKQNENHEGHDHSALETTVWTCSMHPQIRQDKPGECPICGMDLIPLATAQAEGEVADPNEVAISESAAKLADIQTMRVSEGFPQKTVYLQGKVQADERNIAELTARFGGRIEKLFVNFTGQHVQKGEKLATIYSPDLITAQRELLEALSFKEERSSLYMAARSKLRLWDLTDDQINAIEEEGEPQLNFDVLSPISGTVVMRHVAPGDYVKEGSALFQVTDLSSVWVMLDAYESDLPWIKEGDPVELTFQSVPGKLFRGKVSFIDPFIDAGTRIAKVRIELPNSGQQLKPEMFASGTLHSEIAGSSHKLLIPRSSILWTGKRAVVYVKVPGRESPAFVYREITLGPQAGNFYVVDGGLAEGEVIAVNGVFKIDAAAQLEGKPSMMNPGGGNVSMKHDHGSMGEASGGAGSDQNVTITGEPGPLPDQADPTFKEQLQKVYDSYILLNNAFVASDAAGVSKLARRVGSDLKKVDMSLLQGEKQTEWMDEKVKLDETIEQIAGSTEISEQRVLYAQFNLAFYASIRLFGLRQGTIYYQYCPMANGDVGAYWFSNEKEISNPYFGDAMLRCGETKETLEF